MASESEKSSSPALDATGEFFSVGTPLHAVKAGYIRRRADDLLVEAVRAGRYAHVLAPHRTGKTSLIAAAAARVDSDAMRVAIVDLQQLAPKESEGEAGRWFYSFAYRLLRQLRIRFDLQEWWQDKSMLTNAHRLLDFYSEVVLPNVDERIVVFVDALEVLETLSFGNLLLASVRAAHDARSMDPDFQRLTFVLVGDSDPHRMADDVTRSPFHVGQAIQLNDFSRSQLGHYANELGLPADKSEQALDRIFYWTGGHPYITQKLCRAVARATVDEHPDLDEFVDRIVRQQLLGRMATQNEPHLSHIHRLIVGDKQREKLLNCYGRLRKGVAVQTDLGAPAQRRLLSVGLVVLDDDGTLRPRNRIYEQVFTARWANENLPSRFRFYAYAAGLMLLAVAIPFWYTQLLPEPYVRVLTDIDSPPADAQTAWSNFRSFPGHVEAADQVFRSYLVERAARSGVEAEVRSLAALADTVASEERLGDAILAGFFDREMRAALREERRDDALLSSLQALKFSTARRRQRAAALIGPDYPLLLDTLNPASSMSLSYDPENNIVSRLRGSSVEQWSIESTEIRPAPYWELVALDVEPLLRRVVVDADGAVRQIGLTLNVSHPRVDDLLIRLTAPSGKAVTIDPGVERSSTNEEIRIPSAQVRELVGEDLPGTWSLSIRDRVPGVGGHLVAWTLQLNAQGLVEEFQRGLNIPNPVDVPASDVWIDAGGRFAAARSPRGDGVRLWDLAFAKPLGAIATTPGEMLVGLDSNGQRVVAATQDSAHVYDVTSGSLLYRLPINGGAGAMRVLPDSSLLFVASHGDERTTYEMWSIGDGTRVRSMTQDVSPRLETVSGDGRYVATADSDRAVRVWDFDSGELRAQVNLRFEASSIALSYDGQSLAAVYPGRGLSQWRIDTPSTPVFEELGDGDWRIRFSKAGNLSLSGRPGVGYQLRRSVDGAPVGPILGVGEAPGAAFAFSNDETQLVTPYGDSGLRLWTLPLDNAMDVLPDADPRAFAFDMPMAVTPDGRRLVSADREGHLHIVELSDGSEVLPQADELNYIGHDAPVQRLAVSQDGSHAATFADDGLRLWSLESGLPLHKVDELENAEVSALRFSPDGSRVAALTTTRLYLLRVSDAAIESVLDFVEPQQSVTFRGSDKLFVGGSGGTLQSVERLAEGQWSRRPVWQGDNALTELLISPDEATLIIADAQSTLYQLDLATNELRGDTITLPSSITELSHAPAGGTFVARTERFVHLLDASTLGVLWRDAVLIPRTARGAKLRVESFDSFRLPVIVDGRLSVHRIQFAGGDSTGLFGNPNDLYEQWTTRLGLTDAVYD